MGDMREKRAQSPQKVNVWAEIVDDGDTNILRRQSPLSTVLEILAEPTNSEFGCFLREDVAGIWYQFKKEPSFYKGPSITIVLSQTKYSSLKKLQKPT